MPQELLRLLRASRSDDPSLRHLRMLSVPIDRWSLYELLWMLHGVALRSRCTWRWLRGARRRLWIKHAHRHRRRRRSTWRGRKVRRRGVRGWRRTVKQLRGG